MYLDEQLLEKVKQTEISTGDDIINLTYDLYKICVEKYEGSFSINEGKVNIGVTEFAKRRILSAWTIFINELRPINEPLSTWLQKHGFETFFNPKTSKITKSKV